MSLIAFAALELRVRNPLIELSLLRRPAFAGVLVASLLLPIAAFSVFPYISLWLQAVRSMSPIGAGLAVLPLSIAALFTSLTVGRVLHAASPRALIGGGLMLIGAGALTIAHLDARSSWQSLTLGLAITGVGVGLATPALASAALAAVPIQHSGMAAGAVNTMRQLGYALGIAVLGAVLVGHAPAALHPHPGAVINAEFVSGLNAALVTAGVVGLAAALIVGVAAPKAARDDQTAARGRFAAPRYARPMTREEAVGGWAELNRDGGGARQWFAKEKDDGEWEIVSILVKGFRRPDPLKASIETKPKPAAPPDPRPAIFRNIPPFGPG